MVKVSQANDTGTTVNSKMPEGQMKVDMLQGIGLAIMEKPVLENGRIINDGILDYKVITTGEILEIETIFYGKQ